MSRRLRKTIRAGKHANRSAANLPKPNSNRLESWFTRGFARKPNVRAALMVGTALTTAGLGVVADVVVGGSPAMAGVPCPATVNTYSGPQPNGIVCPDVPHDTTIVTTGTTPIGGNNVYHDGIYLSAGASGLFLGVNTGNATAIGLPTYSTVTHDGIHVFSDFGNTTISINNAATIILGNGTGGYGRDGISAFIDSYGNNTISVENTNQIGNATNPVGNSGIYSFISSDGPRSVTYVSNTAPIFASHDGIHSYTMAGENSYSTGGFASTTVFNTGNITAGNRGIYAYSKAKAHEGYYAHAVTVITNTSTGTIVSGDQGIRGIAVAHAYADEDYIGGGVTHVYGGTAVAVVTITNAATITAGGQGIRGFSRAKATAQGYFENSSFGGTAFATTSITNTGNITSGSYGIHGLAYADAEASQSGNVTGGTAGAYVVISNTATITSKGGGIDSYSNADATAYSAPGNATGGVANAVVSIANSGAITSVDDGIHGYAKADSTAYDATFAFGGTSEATVIITNSNTITVSDGQGIHGHADAHSSGLGDETGVGGYAAAAVAITNTSAGVIVAQFDAIYGYAKARANGDAYGGDSDDVGTGGTAHAVVVISNSASLTSFNGDGIHGSATAQAHAGIAANHDTFTASGGTAIAYTHITNTGPIRADDNGIEGFAYADARASASYNGNKTVHGSGTGGYANATVLITNSNTIVAGGKEGILGGARAFTDAYGYTAHGGTASAVLSITNTGNITAPDGFGIYGYTRASADGNSHLGSYGNTSGHFGYGGVASAETYIHNTAVIRSDDDGIFGNATAFALGQGTVKGYGGTAYASTIIVNSGNITSLSEGIDGQAFANATGNNQSPESAYGHAKGGVAIALVDIHNFGFIVSSGDGIVARSEARAKAYGGFDFGGNGTGTGTGGFAHAAVVINNYGAIVSGGEGIDAFTRASGNASGYSATGGQAFAFTGVYNGAKIISQSTGIYAGAQAFAGAEGAYGVFGSATAGTASAEVRIQNGSSFNTAGFIKTYGGPGIFGFARAEANADGYGGKGGTASAQTYIYNFATIVTQGDNSPGIKGDGWAYANGNALTGTAGTAYGKVFIDNFGSITTKGNDSPGIYAYSYAGTDGYTPGTTTAVTVVQNFGSIVTHGSDSPGIDAIATVRGDASASTTVSNFGSIVTSGSYSAGIFAKSYAYDQLGNATAVTRVYNRGVIITRGYDSAGVYAYAGANSPTHTAFATVVVTNSGVIHTYGYQSPAIEVKAAAKGYSEPSSITINNTYSGVIIASGSPNHAVQASGADTTINNRGYIYGNVVLPFGKVNIFNNYATGIWKMIGNSSFGGNSHSTVFNAGIVTIAYTGSNVYLNGLANFHNTGNNGAGVTTGGLVTMINGSPFDRITIANYVGKQVYFFGGTGSRLGVDASLSTYGHADVLQVGARPGQGYVSGTTALIVNNTNTGLGGFNPKGIPVAELGGAPSAFGGTNNIASNFTLTTIHQGLFDWNLFFLPKGAAGNPGPAGFNTWFLASTPSTTAEELPRLLTAAQDIWHDAAGVWLDRTADLRDYYYMTSQACGPRKGGGADLAVKAPPCVPVHGAPGAGVWFRAYGDWIKNNGTASFSAFGQTISHDVHYTQDTGGAQIGADFAAFNWANSALFAGILGGAEDSTVNFNSGTSVHFKGGNIGTYATYLNGSWFADALFLANFMSSDFGSSPDLQGVGGLTGIGTHMNVQQFGGHLDIGYRFQFNPWFFEPQGSIEVVHTEFCGSTAINCFNNPGVVFANTVVSLNDTSVRGRLGGRIGTSWLWGGWTVEPSVTGSVWETFTGTNVASLTSNGFVLDLNDANQQRTQGEVGGMVNVFGNGSSWSGFVKGDYRFASGYSDGSIKGGLRYQWGTGY